MKAEMKTPEKQQIYIITVVGYGSFLFKGTEAEAEQRRKLKAEWEGAAATKRIATENELKTLSY